MSGLYGLFGDEPASTYDLYAQQVVPFAVVTSLEGNQNNAVQFVCVTPNNTQAGSLRPAERPWQNAASAWQVSSTIMMAVAGSVGLALAV